ncbi:MAG: CoA ester lyase [Rhodospirillaceae bacterium]|nr:CoA ester lyase [Rhodospirillaceae bacterium]
MRRTLLFIPAIAQKFLDKAHERGADAIIIDLEDAIAPDAKATARNILPKVVAGLTARNLEVWIRINATPDLLPLDLAAAVIPGVTGLMIPKVEHAATITAIDAEMTKLEAKAGMASNTIGLCATIETPVGILNTAAIAAAPRLRSLGLGCEDLAAAMGVAPLHIFLRGPGQTVALAAAAYGLESWGVAGSIANHSNTTRFSREVRLSRALGITTILCIHPNQVTIARGIYHPTADELAWAKDVVAAYEKSKGEGIGSITVRGQMIDEPIYQRAKRMLPA